MKRNVRQMECVWKMALRLAMCVTAALVLCAAPAGAQSGSASLSGVIVDEASARIPGSQVVLVNQASKSTRTTVANGEGVFNIAGVPAGTYTLTVKTRDFKTFVEKDIALHPGDATSLPTIMMKVGAVGETITVTAHDVLSTNGEVSSLITAEDIKHLATEGRDVTELVKILPGFALQPGAVQGGQGISNTIPDTTTVTPGGSLGNYAASGSPANGIGLISDGADVQDPGAAGATTQNINMDMVQEVKISTSNFGADVAKGPVVINAVGKSGGQSYHGSLYILGRTTYLNSNDWLLNEEGIARPPDRYMYPGFGFGGPVKVPGTNWNKNKKLQFQINGEDYIQRNSFSGGSGSAALRLSTVPTDAMRGGDFSQNALAKLFNVDTGTLTNECKSGGGLSPFVNFCHSPTGVTPKGNPIQGGIFPAVDIDPGAATYLNHLYPHANRVAQPVLGTTQRSDGFDRSDIYLTNTDLYQIRGRIDYNPSDSSKFYIVYNTEQGHSFNPFTLYYNPNTPAGMLRDPSLVQGETNSKTSSANYVKTFGPTLTNELFAAISYYYNPYDAADESVQTKAALGYPYENLIKNGSKQIPQLLYSQGIPNYQGPDFSFGRSFSRKFSPDFGDNITKTWKQHTIKAGFYYERTSNNSIIAFGQTQGSMSIYGTYASWASPGFLNGTRPIGPTGDGQNTIADFMFGNLNSYQEANSNPLSDAYFTTIDGYVTDSWKATRKLTLDMGVRFDHLGPWTDPHGVGAAFWEPQNYTTPIGIGTPVDLKALPGLTWHGVNSSVPNSVELGRWAFVSPRVGFAYDLNGDGKTTFNGGAGMYRSHDSQNSYSGSMNTALGSYTTYLNNPTLYCVDAIGSGALKFDPNNPSAPPPPPYTACGQNTGGTIPSATSGSQVSASNNPSVGAADPNDDQQPLTLTFAFGVTQQLPHAGTLVMNFSGNQSSKLLTSQNINVIPQGGLFRPDPNKANLQTNNNPNNPPQGYGTTNGPDQIAQVDDYRPYPFYNSINVARHGLKSNYNSLQVTWSKWVGAFHYNVNYTWSKAMGERGVDGNGSIPDPTNLRNDYGIAAYDRTHVFNASYTYIMGSPFHVNRLLSGVINGWEISGITNIQSGPNLQAAYSNNFALTTLTPTCAGGGSSASCSTPTDNKSYLGTPDIALQPIMTCDPSTGLKKNQFINSSCLTLGPIGVNGPFHYPYLRGPHYFNSDLSVQKTFHMGTEKTLEFRFSGFNFMNHPLTSLVAATASPLQLFISTPGGPANSAFGISAYKENRRVCEVGLHYNF